MGVIGREALAKTDLLRVTPVDVPELGGTLLLREFAAADVHRLAAAGREVQPGDTLGNLRTSALLLSLCWVDEHGDRVLVSDTDIDTLLAAWPLTLIQRLSEIASTASGLTPTAVEDAKKN